MSYLLKRLLHPLKGKVGSTTNRMIKSQGAKSGLEGPCPLVYQLFFFLFF